MSTRLVRTKEHPSRTGAWLRANGRLNVAAAVAIGLGALAAMGTAHAASAAPAASVVKWHVAYTTTGMGGKTFFGVTAPAKDDA